MLCSWGALPALVPSGPLRSSIPSLLCSPAPWASCWDIVFGHLVYCAIPSPEDQGGLVFPKKTLKVGWVRWRGPPALPASTLTCLPAIASLPVPHSVLGSGTLQIFRANRETDVGGGMGAQRRVREGFLTEL